MTCFSCGLQLTGGDCFSPNLDSQHLRECKRHTITETTKSSNFIPLQILPWSLVLATVTISTFVILHLERKTMAHNFYSFLLISAGINLSIASTFSHAGPDLINILKGITNYFIPLFLPSDPDKLKKPFFFHLLLRITTSFCICFLTAFFKEDLMEIRASDLSTAHWLGICLSLVAAVYSVMKFQNYRIRFKIRKIYL